MSEPSTSGAGAGPSQRVLIGSPAAGMLPDATVARTPAGTVLLDLGPDHPSRAGLLELQLWTAVDDPTSIERVRVRVGAMHRGVEKLYEVRDYRQIMMLADRHDWQAPFSGELGVALLCEQQLGLEVPARATWLRTLLAEHGRAASHLGYLGWLLMHLDSALPLQALREELRRQLARLTGNRIHPMVNQIGGLGVDAEPEWLDAEGELAGRLRDCAVEFDRLLAGPDGAALTDGEAGRGIAHLSPEVIAAYGVSGPAARASGVSVDLRRDRPYLSYPELTGLLHPPTALAGRSGTARRRFAQLAAEVAQSAALMQACIAALHRVGGPVSIRLGKIVRLPEGEGFLDLEAPLGRSGCYVVSRGEKTPWRLKLRTPSFNNVAAWEAILPGTRTSELEVALASLGYVVGDIDK